MSDFDKEAEREKLRKKFARDEQKRASTQRMSELLLKGATMTNKHCSNCSDPLFRYNDQTFCPSCEAAADPQTDADADTETRTQPTTTGTQTEPNDTARQTDSQTAAESGQSQQDATAESFADHPRQPDTHSTSDQSAASSTQRAVDNPGETTYTPLAAEDGGLTAARASLERTLTRFVQRAENTEDPRRARELLAAAREAAATLSELE